MKRLYRVREDRRFRVIRQQGRAYSGDALVLCVLANDLPYSRFGFAVNSRIGNAVTRNRIKRRLREAMRTRMGSIASGWDIILVARRPIRTLDFGQIDAACLRLLRRAKLFNEDAPVSDAPASDAPASDAPASPAASIVSEHA